MDITKDIALSVLMTNYEAGDDDTFVTYRHFRKLDTYFDMDDSGVAFEVTDISAKGGITFCVVAEPDSELLHVSVAICSSKDLYNKELGRRVSFGRFAVNSQYFTISWDRELGIAHNITQHWDELVPHGYKLRDYICFAKQKFLEEEEFLA